MTRENNNADTLITPAPHLAALPALLGYRCLAETLPLLARRPRPDLLADLRDVARWWLRVDDV